MLTWLDKLPAEVDDRTIDWTPRLNGASIESSTWEHSPGIGVEDKGISEGSVTVRISGGENGRRYYFSNSVVLTDGRVLSEVASQLVIMYQPTQMVPLVAQQGT